MPNTDAEHRRRALTPTDQRDDRRAASRPSHFLSFFCRPVTRGAKHGYRETSCRRRAALRDHAAPGGVIGRQLRTSSAAGVNMGGVNRGASARGTWPTLERLAFMAACGPRGVAPTKPPQDGTEKSRDRISILLDHAFALRIHVHRRASVRICGALVVTTSACSAAHCIPSRQPSAGSARADVACAHDHSAWPE